MPSLSPNGAAASPQNNFQTPVGVIEAARTLLGGRIALDPASCASANERVKADTWFGPGSAWASAQDGLQHAWHGTVFLNPPGSARGTSEWWRKLLEEYNADRVTSAIYICFAIDALQWTQRHNEGGCLAFPTFVPDRRIAYHDPLTGALAKSPPKPSAIVWLPGAGDHERDTPHELRARMTAAFKAQDINGVTVGGDS